MASEFSHWPVLAWIRLRIPEAPPALMLIPGPPPPPEPPLDEMLPAPISTDPRRRLFAWEGKYDQGAIRIVWEADNPSYITAEYRERVHAGRPAAETVRRFWSAVKVHVQPLGTLPVEAADPWP
jgi:hypothetical protein